MARVLHVFPSFATGGSQMRLARILELWPGHEHRIVAMDGRHDCVEQLPASATFAMLPAPPRAGSWATSRRFGQLLRDVRPALVLTYNWGAIEMVIACWRERFARLVHHEDGFGADEIERLKRRRSLVRRLFLRRAQAVVVPSRRLERIATGIWRLPAARVRWLPNGVDLVRFAPRARPPAPPVVVGTVGGLRPEKHQELLLRAFARLRQADRARLRIVGDGPDRERLQALAAQLGIAGRTEFTGAIRDTAPCYAQMHLFALSSKTEQMPLSVLEAMASGLPVVSPQVGDVAAMVAEPNRAWIVPPEDPAALAAALDVAIAEPELCARIGAANRARCEQEYELTACLGRYVALYEAVLGRG
jgi:glycosyltransferase involved in cell wall biosynthesis